MIMLDTHALLWWTLYPRKLSRKASEACERIIYEGALISSISIWEIGIKIKKGKLDIGKSLEEYVERLKKLRTLEIAAVDENIWMRNLSLDWDHPDPADRTIVATAELKELSIVTKDQLITNYYPHVIW
ncbi:MAG: type II toxin-antitoxin system VapC family toxin [Candidatus Aminicenantes bacterium]|nr:type II toxin-antitoxin system VapC family toxin [Candidatus Aminicenantes bacterium]